MRKDHILSGSLAVIAICSTSMAAASGTILSPERQQKMESFGACLAYLQNSAEQDSKSEAPLTKDAEGVRRQVTVERTTKDVVQSGKASAYYSAQIWYLNGRPRPDVKQIEYRASWEKHAYECRGPTLIINASQGYTSETYEPMDAEEAAKYPAAQAEKTGAD